MGTEPSYAEYPQHFYDAEDASSYVQASHVRPGPGSDPDCLSVASPMFQASRSSNFHDSSPFPPNTSHPSNGEMPNRSYVRRASCGTSNVNDITHSSASPSASRPVSTFSNQNRRASSTQPSEQSSAEENSHTLTVYRRTPEGSRPLPQIPVNPALLRNLPGIYAYIREDRRQGKYSTSVTAEKPVAGEALNSMIDITLRGTQLQPKPSFGQFVDLAIACWYCKIPISPIQRWADEFQNDLQRYGFSNRTLNHFHSWMFLALIFVWPEVFRSTSKVLISQYTIRDDGMEQRRFLPERLEVAIQDKRAEVLSKTYEFILEKYRDQIAYHRDHGHNPLFRAIHGELKVKLGIDIDKSLERNQEVASSSTLLDVFDSIILATLQTENVPPMPSPQNRKPPTVGSQRRPSVIPATRMGPSGDQKLLGDAMEGLKKKLKRGTKALGDKFQRTRTQPEVPPPITATRSNATSVETIRVICETLLEESSEHRKRHFSGLDIRDYLPLRATHVPTEEFPPHSEQINPS